MLVRQSDCCTNVAVRGTLWHWLLLGRKLDRSGILYDALLDGLEDEPISRAEETLGSGGGSGRSAGRRGRSGPRRLG